MKKKKYSDLILILIARANGKWSWYQVERALDLRGIGGIVDSTKIINELIEAGFLEGRKNSNEDLTVYLTTNKGDEKANQLICMHGNQAFDPSEKDPKDYI